MFEMNVCIFTCMINTREQPALMTVSRNESKRPFVTSKAKCTIHAMQVWKQHFYVSANNNTCTPLPFNEFVGKSDTFQNVSVKRTCVQFRWYGYFPFIDSAVKNMNTCSSLKPNQ